ncbi:MAG: ROK family protein [Tissierellia bacterium]|nr:ROK family protein [Tissierellia bacterium]
MKILAIDIGGTTIKADVYDQKGISLGEFVEVCTKINHKEKTNDILNQVIKIIKEKDSDIVAISSAGVIDENLGKVIFAGETIPGFIGVDFKGEIKKQTGKEAFVLNDVNAAAMGELYRGNATEDSVVITIGTGVGGCIIKNGSIIPSENFSQGEIGYIPIGEKSFQQIASATFLSKEYKKRKQLDYADGKMIFDQYDNNEEIAISLIDEFCKNLAKGLLPILYLLNPKTIVIGGGIIERCDVLIPKIVKNVERMIENDIFMADIKPAKLKNEAGRLGALYFALKQLNKA